MNTIFLCNLNGGSLRTNLSKIEIPRFKLIMGAYHHICASLCPFHKLLVQPRTFHAVQWCYFIIKRILGENFPQRNNSQSHSYVQLKSRGQNQRLDQWRKYEQSYPSIQRLKILKKNNVKFTKVKVRRSQCT
jgi:hypothetical protein